MQKKLITLAVAAAFSAPALAGTISTGSTADITVYGKVFMTVDQFDDGNSTHASVTRFNTNSSRLGIKGSEEIGDGLKALFQYEVAVDADGQTGNGFGRASRNSGAGLQGGFGKVIVGTWDSPYKVVHNKIELFDNDTEWTALKVIGNSNGKNYNTRQKNMLQYWTPVMGGVQAAVMYSPDEVKNNALATPPVNQGNKNIVSASLAYKMDNIDVSGAYERRNDQTTVGKTDSAFRVAGKYTLGDVWVGGIVESIKSNKSAAVSKTATNWELVGEYKIDKNRVALSYAQGGSTATGGAAKNDVSQITAKYAYGFSKRTDVFAAYMVRDLNATNTKANAIGVGIIHAF